MKNKILLIALILFTLSLSAQQSIKEKELANKTVEQLNASLRSTNTLITTGIIVTGVGVAATVIGIKNYSSKSKEVNDDNGIIDNQVGMNKTIPAAMIGVGGVILTGAGLNILVKGILKNNDIKVELVKYSFVSNTGVGLTLNF